MAERMMEIETGISSTRVTIMPRIYGEIVPPGTQLYNDTRQLLATQFGRVQAGIGGAPSYVEATATSPEHTLPIAVYKDSIDKSLSKVMTHSTSLLGTARVELAGATLIESMIILQPSSPSRRALESGIVAEIGSFAVIDGLTKASLLDVIDTIVAMTLQIARERGIDYLWIFPRNGFMSLLRADIPELVPPYRFTLCQDVSGWNERSVQLRKFRDMRLRGLGKWPDIFQISRIQFEEDLSRRRLTADKRRAQQAEIERLLPPAMLRAQRDVRHEAATFYAAMRGTRRTSPPAISTTYTLQENRENREHSPASAVPASSTPTKHTGFLPFSSTASTEGRYLRDVVRHGGNAAGAYKNLSRQLLKLAPSQRVLDVGCGSGVDLVALSEAVGPYGRVVGIDHNIDRVRDARTTIVERGQSNVTVLLADVEHLTLPTGEFDRVRADRVIQHIDHHRMALTEMWRVLAPGGILSVVEPDWASIAIAPASAKEDNDDTTLTHILAWCRRHLRHPLIGRQLHGLLHEQGPRAWQEIAVTTEAYTFTNWNEVDTVLQLSNAAQALVQERPELANEIATWRQMVEAASHKGTFFAAIPLFFATARKVN